MTRTRTGGPLPGLARRMVFRVLEDLHDGEIILREGDAERRFGRVSSGDGSRATIRVHDPGFYSRVAFHGSVGAGESFARGDWSTDDLTAVIRILARNAGASEGLRAGIRRLGASLARASDALRRNTRRGSRRNIKAHYDLSNEFFALFLDPSMTYSCGIFDPPGCDLETASVNKLDRICRVLELGPDDHVLEIGTGWGSFALHAAGRYGCRVTTTTISDGQHAMAGERIREAGLAGRVELLRRDYRDLDGEYDHLVSIEMIEAVGAEYLDTFFEICGRCLKPGGRMLLQAITIQDELFDRARATVDFIKAFIFPGSCIPSLAALRAAIVRVGNLAIDEVHDITEHYPPTLREWKRNLVGAGEAIRALGFDDEFLRLWEFYFCYCEGGFLERRIGDVQMLLTRSGERRSGCGA